MSDSYFVQVVNPETGVRVCSSFVRWNIVI
jgi:hypothetical protein